VDQVFDGHSFYAPYDKVTSDWTIGQLKKSRHPAVVGILEKSGDDVRVKRQKVVDTRQLLKLAEALNTDLKSFFGHEAASVQEIQSLEVPEVLRLTVAPLPPDGLGVEEPPAIDGPPLVSLVIGAVATDTKRVTKCDIMSAIYLESSHFTADVARHRVKEVLDRDSNGSTLRYLCHNPKLPGSYPLYLEKVDSEGNRLPSTASKHYYFRFTAHGRAYVHTQNLARFARAGRCGDGGGGGLGEGGRQCDGGNSGAGGDAGPVTV
jgi:hypothetical protein